MATKTSTFIEYVKLHLTSLNQDLEANDNPETKIHLDGQIEATRHLLSVAFDIMKSSNERYE